MENPVKDILHQAETVYNPSSPKGEKGKKKDEPRPVYGMEKVGEMRNELIKLAETAAGPLTQGSWLVASVALKRVEEAANELRTKAILGHANRQYEAAMVGAAAKLLPIDGAMLKKYSYPAKYEYPATIIALEDELKRKKKAAESDGSARQLPRTVDPEVDTVFTIAL